MKIILQILLIFLVVATISVCTIKPEMHKNVIVYDSSYTLVPEQEVKTETKEIPVMEMPVKPKEKTVKVEHKVVPNVVNTKIKTESAKIQKVTPKKTTKQNKVITQPVSKQETKVAVTPKLQPQIKTEKKVEPIKKEKNAVETNINNVPVKTLTQQEETIAWNKWRSNLTNAIMHDTKLPAIPSGVIFQFSFNVDEYGKVSNVQTGANPSNYTPYAIQYIAPVIRSYQGRSILNFPEGTARTSTNVTGKWRISSTEKYSTPQDYKDIEVIKR